MSLHTPDSTAVASLPIDNSTSVDVDVTSSAHSIESVEVAASVADLHCIPVSQQLMTSVAAYTSRRDVTTAAVHVDMSAYDLLSQLERSFDENESPLHRLLGELENDSNFSLNADDDEVDANDIILAVVAPSAVVRPTDEFPAVSIESRDCLVERSLVDVKASVVTMVRVPEALSSPGMRAVSTAMSR